LARPISIGVGRRVTDEVAGVVWRGRRPKYDPNGEEYIR